MRRLRKTIGGMTRHTTAVRNILLILVVLVLYRQFGYTSNNLKGQSVNNTSGDHADGKPDFFQNRCSLTKGIDHNGADLQVSDLVENLEFQSENPAEGHYPNLQPLPATEELTVFLIPHSHCDPGWLLTYEEYFDRKARHLLNNLYQFAVKHEDFKYIYAEVSFFKLWWERLPDEVRQDMRRLAREGRFEFVQGGWVQTDEANTHYFAILNEMLDGHEWLKRNFPDAKPRVGWAIDPFGLSPVMAQVNKLFGLDAMYIQRVHYTVKKHLAEHKQIQFRWRQSWDSDGETDILTQIGPFAGHASKYTCGPDPNVCLQYNFEALIDLKFPRHSELVNTTPENVKERSLKILDQWRKKAALHAANAIFIEVGDDFSYVKRESVETVYSNYMPMMEHINNSPELNTQVKWGTVSDYFDHIKGRTGKFPSLSGDFFTYADRLDHYWSGYFTTRPFYKNLDRVLESSLRRTEILFSFQRAKEGVRGLTTARNTLSLFQHHDAITGTAKPKVVDDYGLRLFKAYRACDDLSTTAIRHIMNYVETSVGKDFQPTRQRTSFKELEKYRVLDEPVELVIVSTIARNTAAAQIIAVKTHLNFKVVSSEGEVIPQQVEPAIEYGKFNPDSKFIVFWTELPSVSINTYHLTSVEQDKVRTRVKLYNFGSKTQGLEILLQTTFEMASQDEPSKCEDIVLGRNKLAIILDCKSGRLKSMKKERKTVAVEQEVLLYPSGRSGAYLFLPTGTPSQLLTDSTRPEIVIVKGSLRDKAVVTLNFQNSTLVLTYIVYHHRGSEGQFVELEIMSDLRNNGDLAIRLKTDIKSGDSIFTDLNGHTIQHHKYKKKLHTQGNFFPMPSTAFIQDSSTRLSLLASEPHGVASLAEGWIEVIIDRRNTHDDDKGLGEGITDNIPTPAHLRILVEARSETQIDTESYLVEYPSLASHWILQTLLHPAFILSGSFIERNHPAPSVQLIRTLPCDEELVNLRFVEDQTCQLIRRKLGFTCAIGISTSCDYQDVSLEELFTEDVIVDDHPFSPFHHKTDSNKGDLKAMEFSSQYVTFSI